MILMFSLLKNERPNNATLSFMYLLAIVILSYVYAAMLLRRERQSGQFDHSGRIATVVVYQPSNTNGQSVLSDANSIYITGMSAMPSQIYKEPPPAYSM